jgi:hypothetical protein
MTNKNYLVKELSGHTIPGRASEVKGRRGQEKRKRALWTPAECVPQRLPMRDGAASIPGIRSGCVPCRGPRLWFAGSRCKGLPCVRLLLAGCAYNALEAPICVGLARTRVRLRVPGAPASVQQNFSGVRVSTGGSVRCHGTLGPGWPLSVGFCRWGMEALCM